MEPHDDTELLRRYAEENAEGAFAELVGRRVGFVYAGALRRVGGDTHLAEDVTQQVFTALARRAGELVRHPALSAWLFATTRNLSAHVVRGERRRRVREQEAQTMMTNEFSGTTGAATDGAAVEWERLRPVLDEALDELEERDREAVLLRFNEGKSFADVGARLWLAENAARMRVDRALDKLHAALARRGVTSTAAALGVALGNQALASAPAGLAATVTNAAVAGVGAVGVVAGVLTFMSTTKITMGVVAAVALAAVGAALYEARQVKQRDEKLAEVAQQDAALRAKVANLEGRLKTESGRAQAADADSGKLLEAVENFKSGMGAKALEASKPITREIVEARFTRALQLTKSGQHAEALKEFLWCYDEGMVRVTSLYGERYAVLKQIADLGAKYPEALSVLRARRDAAEKRVLLKGGDAEAGAAFASINQLLNERERTFAAYEQMDPGSVQRGQLGTWIYDDLIERRRYQDALAAKTFAMMSSTFENWANARNQNVPGTEAKARMNWSKWIEGTAKNIEVLAGAGALGDARSLATRLLRVDGTEKTRALVQKGLERAGQAGLLAGAVGGK